MMAVFETLRYPVSHTITTTCHAVSDVGGLVSLDDNAGFLSPQLDLTNVAALFSLGEQFQRSLLSRVLSRM